ncbi:uncharacterized protein LOC135202136 [Macrobrachium nipponense]|uniref:uncharacterized protein LOC135202136 n=1 Tax=Macrobrachium nipponense TaxID=159736 RepID=UPI0030C7B8D1
MDRDHFWAASALLQCQDQPTSLHGLSEGADDLTQLGAVGTGTPLPQCPTSLENDLPTTACHQQYICHHHHHHHLSSSSSSSYPSLRLPSYPPAPLPTYFSTTTYSFSSSSSPSSYFSITTPYSLPLLFPSLNSPHSSTSHLIPPPSPTSSEPPSPKPLSPHPLHQQPSPTPPPPSPKPLSHPSPPPGCGVITGITPVPLPLNCYSPTLPMNYYSPPLPLNNCFPLEGGSVSETVNKENPS